MKIVNKATEEIRRKRFSSYALFFQHTGKNRLARNKASLFFGSNEEDGDGMSLLTPDRRIRTSVFEEGDEMREEETRGLSPERFLFPHCCFGCVPAMD